MHPFKYIFKKGSMLFVSVFLNHNSDSDFANTFEVTCFGH